MRNLFGRKKPRLKDISIPTFDLSLVRNEAGIQQWMDAARSNSLSLHLYSSSADLPSLKDIDGVRDYYRQQLLKSGGGIVEVELAPIKGLQAIRTIFKFPMEPKGMAYLGSWTIPFADYAFVVKIQSTEVEATGLRDNAVAVQMTMEGKISVGDDDSTQGWLYDPYGVELPDAILMNLSEQEMFDEAFPDHPLSRVRFILKAIAAEIELGDPIRKLKPFER